MEFTLQNNATDEFRAPAVAASQRALKAAGTFADPAAAGISYCLPHLEDAPEHPDPLSHARQAYAPLPGRAIRLESMPIVSNAHRHPIAHMGE